MTEPFKSTAEALASWDRVAGLGWDAREHGLIAAVSFHDVRVAAKNKTERQLLRSLMAAWETDNKANASSKTIAPRF